MSRTFRSVARLALAAAVAATALLTSGNVAVAATPCDDGWMMMVTNAGFEDRDDGTPVPGWCMEGVDNRGVDRGLGIARSGSNDAFIESVMPSRWNAITQHLPLVGGTDFVARAWVKTSTNVADAYFGVRVGTSTTVYENTKFGPMTKGWTLLEVRFSRTVPPYPAPPSLTDITVFVGYWSPSGYSYVMVDDVCLYPDGPLPGYCS